MGDFSNIQESSGLIITFICSSLSIAGALALLQKLNHLNYERRPLLLNVHVFWLACCDLFWCTIQFIVLLGHVAFDFSYGDGFCDAFGSVSLFFRLASVSWSFMIICCLFALLQGFTFHQICTSIKYQHFVVWTISICFPLIVLFSSPRPFSTEHYVIQNVCLPCAIADEVVHMTLYSFIGFYVFLGTILLFQFSVYFRNSVVNDSIKRVHMFIFVFILSWLAPIIVTSMQVEGYDIPLALIWLHNLNMSGSGILNYLVWMGIGKRQTEIAKRLTPTNFYDIDAYNSDFRSPSFDTMSDGTNTTSLSYFTDGTTELDVRKIQQE